MCGIAGEVTFGKRRPSRESVARMCERLVHRGPDEGGFHVSPQAVLGIRRLKVTGLVNGSQPVANSAGTAFCVFNGEIYNYRELKAGLERDGYVFKTNTDAEVVIHLYDRKGEGFVKDLRGMFAIAIYDEVKKRLLLTRDRAGKKPLNYTFTPDGSVVFASELHALVSHPSVRRRVNTEAVDRFLSFRIIPAPLTIYGDVFKVEPATVLTFDERGMERKKYWRFDFTERETAADEGELIRKMTGLLREAVEVRLRSEVALGALLSGGLDSSLVVSIMSRLVSDPVHTFSIGFQDKQFDELRYARLVSEHCGTVHHEHVITPDSALGVIHELLLNFGEPYAFPSAIATYFMNHLARQFVTVVLTGDGADELFCGYNRYKTFDSLTDLLERGDLPVKVDRELLGGACGDISVQYQSVLTDGLRDSVKRRLYSKAFRERLGAEFPANYLRERFARTGGLMHRLDRAMEVDCNFWLPDAQLVKIDITSMANSVEVRCPMLDAKLIEFVTGVGVRHKLAGGNEKQILKRLAANFLPAEIVNRRKQELAVPLEHWLTSSLRGEITRTLLSEESLARGYFDPDRLTEFVGNYGEADSYAVWTLYILEVWHRTAAAEAPFHGAESEGRSLLLAR
ncbi:MAG: asparagine synthase (glutamine-hydrolyzing) [Pyrinomonadaceae bacterium]